MKSETAQAEFASKLLYQKNITTKARPLRTLLFLYYPIQREDAALHEAEDFLSRVYHGSVSMLVSSLTKKQALSKAEIVQLHAILDEMEGRQQTSVLWQDPAFRNL